MITSFLPKGQIRPQTGNMLPQAASPVAQTFTAHHAAKPQRQAAIPADQFTSRAASKPTFAGKARILTTILRYPTEVMDTDGNTWTHYAVKAGDLKLLKEILAMDGVDLRVMDNQGMNPYTACAVTRKPDILEITKLIRDAGGRLQAFPPDSIQGYTTSKPFIHPSDMARKWGTEEVRQLFLKEEEKALRGMGYTPSTPQHQRNIAPPEEPGILTRIYNAVTGFFF